MCQALKELIEEGRMEGIEALILDNLEEGTARERIIEKLQWRFQLAEDKAIEYYERYAKKSA